MKKNVLLIIWAFLYFYLPFDNFAQAPAAFKYQAIARDSHGSTLVNKSISIKITIIKGGERAETVYEEEHAVTTNNYGLVNLEIGDGKRQTGIFSSIDWSSGNYFIQIGLDPKGGDNYSVMGVSQLLSVPYALYAENAGSANDSRTNDLDWGKRFNEKVDVYTGTGGSYPDGNVGIGTFIPQARLEVVGQIKITGGSPGAGKVLFSDANGLASWCFPSFSEIDPIYSADPASSILAGDITSWNTAYGWGDHATVDYQNDADTSTWDATRYWVDQQGYLTSISAETDPVYSADPASGIVAGDITDWNIAFGWGDHATEGYLTSYTETDPIFNAHMVAGITASDTGDWNTAYSWGDHATVDYQNDADTSTWDATRYWVDQQGYLTSISAEIDPVYSSDPASGILAGDITDWNSAYGWGDHATEGYLTSYTETDPIFNAHMVAGITASDTGDWNTAYSWGDHATVDYQNDADTSTWDATRYWVDQQGYLTSISAETDPVYSADPASGILAGDITDWNSAYGWGDHATEGYLTSYTETDPIFIAHMVAGITASDTGDWNRAYSWGDHATIDYQNDADTSTWDATRYWVDQQGYLTSISAEIDPVYSSDPASGILAGDITDWNNAYGWGDHATEGYLTSYTETDPIFSSTPASGILAGDITSWNTSYGWGDHATEGYLTSYTETDPIFNAHMVAGITATDTSNWNTAYGWGDHATVDYQNDADTSTWDATRYWVDQQGYLTSISAEIDPVYSSDPASGILAGDITDWNNAYGWGDHATEGYLTSYTETDPIFSSTPASGILAGDITSWNTSYGWGDHATEGYLTSYTETDPIFNAHMVAGITASDTGDWNTAYSWGDHATVDYQNDADTSSWDATRYWVDQQGYLTSIAAETDPVYSADPASGIVAGDITDWNTAYGWGDHATEGYLTSYTETDPIFNAHMVAGITASDTGDWNTAYSWGDHATVDYQNDADTSAWDATRYWVGQQGYLTSTSAETDPIYSGDPASGILAGDITDWNTAFGWGNHATAGYLTSYTETDPIFSSAPASSILAGDITSWNTAYGWGDHATAGYLTSYTETDPIFNAHMVAGITASDTGDWNTAYSWGDHATVDYQNDADTSAWDATRYWVGQQGYLTSTSAETDPIYSGDPASGILAGDITDWNTAFGWGNHATEGYLTSYTETDPIFSSAPASGILAGDITSWNSAYGWGDHSSQGYLTSEADPVFTASAAGGITAAAINFWNVAYGWGNHATVGYLTSYTETDPVYSSDPASNIAAGDISNWNTAYGWGNHASEGYLTAETDPKVGANTTNYLSKWDGSALVTSAVFDDGNIGIGNSSPSASLDLIGSFKYQDGNQNTGKVLTSDANGNATWQDAPGSDDGDWTISGNDLFSAMSGNIGIGSINPAEKLDIDGNISADTLKSHVLLYSHSNATYNTLKNYIDFSQSATIWTGGTITDNGDGSIEVTGGTGMIKTSYSPFAENVCIDFPENLSIPLVDEQVNWVYVDYNSGTPFTTASTDIYSIDKHTQVIIGKVFRNNLKAYIMEAGQRFSNFQLKSSLKDFEVFGFMRASGLMVSETGTRNLAVTSGVGYFAHNRVQTPTINTATGDVFSYYFKDGSGGWTKISNNTQIDNLHYDDGSGTLATLSNNKYGIHWVYVTQDGALNVLFGQGNYGLNDALLETSIPTPPIILSDFSMLVGKVIIKKGANVYEELSSAFEKIFTYSTPQSHNELSSLQGGAALEYYHLNSTDYNYLVSPTSQLAELRTDGSPTFGGLTINNNLTYNNGQQGDGKVLTSDANGNASWETPSASSVNPVIQCWSTSAASVNVIIPEAVRWDREDFKDPDFTHSTIFNTSRIYVDENGWFEVNYSIAANSPTGTRFTLRTSIRVNGATILDRGVSYSYSRNLTNDKQSNSPGTVMIQLNSGDYIEIMCERAGDNTEARLIPTESHVMLKFVRGL